MAREPNKNIVSSTPEEGNKGGELFGSEQEPDTSFDPANFEEPASSNTEAKTSGPDPFDPEALRLDCGLATAQQVKKVILSVPTRKPDKSWFIRTHPDAAFRIQTGVIELKEDREIYLVAKNLWPDLMGEATFRPKLLVTAINRQGTLFLWELNLPRPDGKVDEWTRTALEAVNLAQDYWVRVTANMNLGAYEVAKATANLPSPEWPEMAFKDILRIAFRDRFINTADHEVLRRLRGEV